MKKDEKLKKLEPKFTTEPRKEVGFQFIRESLEQGYVYILDCTAILPDSIDFWVALPNHPIVIMESINAISGSHEIRMDFLVEYYNKIPQKKKQLTLSELNDQLQKAIDLEEYEKAAKIRNRIEKRSKGK